MQSNIQMPFSQQGSSVRTLLFIIIGAVAFMFFAYSVLPKGFSDDLAQIGQGSNIVLLVHDHDSVQSLNLMGYLGDIRSDYLGKAVFVVADDSSIKGQNFINQQKVGSGDLMFFSPSGKRIRVVQGVKNVDTLRELINKTF